MITIKLKTKEERLAMRSALSAGCHGLHSRENATRKEKTIKKLAKERVLLLGWMREIEKEDRK